MPMKYLKCRNAVMTYMDPENHFKVPRGRIVPYDRAPTRTMQKWIRRGGLLIVDEAQYLAQTKADPTSEPAPQTPHQPENAPMPEPEPVKEKTRTIPPEEKQTAIAEDEKPKAEEPDSKTKKAKKKSGGNV
ncbi:MAG: hypothetical protein COV45_09240 [Deltaproteobacteria bacterium CG11_big_fil_rev_8_21_14_0_20_47_16]|nr:MAG: hypothetical protein COV45_09240 [Deltaproteobacteria bacterium CG11_big_fil_rev_8_21_14_0_20_47_16]